MDWVAAGALLPVANEGNGVEVSWAYAAAASIAAAVAIKTGALPPALSVQQLIDCAGGWATVRQYTLSKGVCTASSYPSGGGGACHDAGCQPAARVLSWVDVLGGSEAATTAALAQQPLYGAVDQSSTEFMGYMGGVLNASDCGSNVNHYVTLTGYGADSKSGEPFYTAQNCWSAAWGEKVRALAGEQACAWRAAEGRVRGARVPLAWWLVVGR